MVIIISWAIIISALRAYRLRNDVIAPILLSHIRL